MTDFATGRHKKLDLVIARPPQVASIAARSFKGLAARYGIELTDLERGVLEALPDIYVGEVGAVLIAQEAKACRTAHIKALPRLYDELNSSHLCVHGASRAPWPSDTPRSTAATRSFVSSVANNYALADRPASYTEHRQPGDTERVVQTARVQLRPATAGTPRPSWPFAGNCIAPVCPCRVRHIAGR